MIDKRYFICEICRKVFTPASNLRKHIVTTMGRNHYFGPNLCWLWLQFQLERLKMVHTHKKNSSVSWCCFHFPVWTHCSLGLFSCVELHFGLLSAEEKLMYLQDCGFGEMFVTISSMSAFLRPLPAWAFMCIFKLCPLKDGFMHIYHAESFSPVSSDHVDLQTLPTLASVFVSTFSRNKAFTQCELSCASSSCFH